MLPANKNLVIVSTFPDFDDTARAVKDALAGSRYRVAFIVARTSRVPDWVDTADDRVLSRRSLRGIIAFHRARWVLITHGLYSELPRTGRQFFINLWHGMPIKRVGAMLGELLPHTDIAVAATEDYREIMSEVLDVSPEQVVVAPHPRIDIMLSVSDEQRRRYFGDKWVLLWLPTFRERTGSRGRRDGVPEESILCQISRFRSLHKCLKDLNAVCVIKPHPLEAIVEVSLDLPETVQIWTDNEMADQGLSLYQLIGLSDALITDISSVYFEYVLLDRPVFCYFPDIEAYKSGRGFVRPLESLLDVPILQTEEELVDQLHTSFEARARVLGPKGRQSTIARQLLRECGLELH